MKKIRYFRINDRYLAIDIRGREDGIVEMNFGEELQGKLIIGNRAYKIEGGRTVINTVGFEDGAFELFVIKDKKSLPAEGFEKCGRIIKLLPLSELYTRELLKRQAEAEEKIRVLEEHYLKLSDKIAHTTIF